MGGHLLWDHRYWLLEDDVSRTLLSLTALVFVALSVSVAFGQEIEGYYEKGKLVEIKDLLSSDELESCAVESKRYAGTVTGVRFSEGSRIGDFTLKTSRGNVKILISETVYERISKADANALPTLVAKARRITVDAHQCGTTRRAMYILAGIHTEMLGE